MQTTPDKFDSTRDFIRIWRNEMHKVVYDRLATIEDRKLFSLEIIGEAVKRD